MTKMNTALLVVLLVFSGQAAANNHRGKPLECHMYMGPSTIPNAGIGIFTGVDLNVDDRVGDGDICIPIIDYEVHNPPPVFNPLSDYVWGGEIMGMMMETGTGDIEAICPGLDCVIFYFKMIKRPPHIPILLSKNCNMALLNVAKATPVYDDGGLHRSSSPGSGSISPYHNGTTRVIRDVPAGGELFKSYGESWFTSRPHFGNIPLPHDYDLAQKLLAKFDSLTRGMSEHGLAAPHLYDVLLEFQSSWNSRSINAIPDSFQKAKVAIAEDIGATHQPSATRTIEWLNDNAKCVDHIVPKESTLKDAGRGAFAKRDIPDGTIITGTPLHHFPKRELMRMAMLKSGNQSTEKSGDQVLLNYCFGHKVTTVLVCPYGVGVNYINHNQTQANVEIRWSKEGTSNQNNSWLEMSPEQMSSQLKSSLGFDYVATRDIEEGEELFLDYGDAWEQAWNSHKSSWENGLWAGSKNYLNSHDWNEVMSQPPLRTEDEAFYDPYPPNLQLRCHYLLLDSPDWRNEEVLDWDNLNEYGYPCRILERYFGEESREYEYTVEVTRQKKDRWDGFDGSEDAILDYIPRHAISFLDVPYTTDLHLPSAFRKEIGIPLDMVPESWKNRL